MEILLRHTVQWLGMMRSPAVNAPGVLDNEKAFIEDLGQLSAEEKKSVLCVHLLACSLDGGINEKEYHLWKQVCEAVDEAEYIPDRVGYLACRFRNLVPLTAKMIEDCFDKNAKVFIPTGWGGFRCATPHAFGLRPSHDLTA